MNACIGVVSHKITNAIYNCSDALVLSVYLASKENKNQWIIDEEAAEVVRRIFQMVIDGKGVNEIGITLRAEQIPIPSEHWKRIGAPVRSSRYTDPYAWSPTTVGYILSKPEYMGRKVLGKTVCESYKTKKHRHTEPEERYVFDGAIPVIVDEETWHNAGRLRKTVRRSPKSNEPPHRLTGLLFCSDCGAKMTHRNAKVKTGGTDNSYICGSYRQLTRDCTMHYISTRNMEKLILTAIQRVSRYARENEDEFVQKVRKSSAIRQEESAKEHKRQLGIAKQRHKELDSLVKKLYESYATGIIPDKHFERLLADYDSEQVNLESAIAELKTELDSFNCDSVRADKFIEMVKRYTDFSELTTPMVNEFIEKIIVHEATGGRKDRKQSVDIHLNFIGAFVVPDDIVIPEKTEEEHRNFEEKAMKKQKQLALSNEKRKSRNAEFQARKKANLLTAEEEEKEQRRLEKNRVWFRQYRQSKKDMVVVGQ